MNAASGGSLSDPYLLTSVRGVGPHGDTNREAAGRTLVWPHLTPGQSTAVIVAVGQSNAGSFAQGLFTPTQSLVHNFNINNGACYDAVEPLLGAHGTSGSVLTRLADKLRAAGTYQRVIVVPAAVGATSVAQWAAGGEFNHRIPVTARRLASRGLAATHVIWHGGESDTLLGTSQADYTTRLQSVIDTFRAAGISAPILVCKASYIEGATSAAVIAGQTAVLNSGAKVYAGANTDTLGAGKRYDNTHFTATGCDDFANLLLPQIQALA